MRAAAAVALVIDDEPLVRHLIRRYLEPEVCAVVEADGGEEGLRVIQRQRDAIDLVLTDLVMPDIDGLTVVKVLAAHHPNLPVLCMSGYPLQGEPAGLAVNLLPKPFTADTLRDAIVPLLERSRASRAEAATGRQQADASRQASRDLAGEARAIVSNSIDLVSAARALHSRGAPPRPLG